jgi:uncharacterized protein YqgC (DUF456 family)
LETLWLILAGLAMLIAAVGGTLLTVLTLPGLWLTLLIALVLQLVYRPEPLLSWWTLGVCLGLAIIAEVIELVASAAGAAKSGGGRSGAWGSIIGSLIGALAGSFLIPVPIVGTIAGAVIGAAAGAITGERGIAGRTWRESFRIGRGAAKGRFFATVVKSGIAALIGAILTVAAFVP